jgi:hypothetical protein
LAKAFASLGNLVEKKIAFDEIVGSSRWIRSCGAV